MIFSKSLPFLFSCCTSFLVLLAATPHVDAFLDSNVTAAECLMGFSALRLDMSQFHYYNEWFRPESKIILAQAGTYYGPQDMAEYYAFATPSSPYVLERNDILKSPPRLKHIRDGICTLLSFGTSRFVLDPEKASDATLLVSAMIKVKYNFKENYVSEVYVHFTDEWYKSFFGSWLNNENTRQYICDISKDRCPNTNVGMGREECMQKLEDMPTLTDGTQFDGYDFGCRALHSVLAKFNEKHCPHISFEPQLDQDNKYKCQESSGLRSSDLFDEDDFQTFGEYNESKESLVESATGFKILSQTPEYSTQYYIMVGLVASLVIFLTAFFLIRKAQTTESDKKRGSNPLFADNLRQFRIILGTLLTSLVLVIGVVVAIIWAMAGIHPEWVREEFENELEDRYRGENGLVLGSIPHELMTDSQFRVYAGFIVWVGVLIAGLGLEIFVWYHFLQFWSKVQEGLWRFSQFIFPLLLVTSLGLAFHQDFLALPILVVGLWKFGFPETLMYFYLGLFTTSKCRKRRASDFLNGVGTVTHHGAASFVVSMLCIGVAPASRYILNSCLILVMQHWVALLAYANLPLYSAITLTLEFWFQWVVLSDFSQIYYLHWTMALGAGIMLFAHWLYLIAAVLNMFADEPSNEEDNVHKRGQNIIDSTHRATEVPSNPSNPSVSPTRVWDARDGPLARMSCGSSLRGVTREGSSLRGLNRRESVTLLEAVSNQRDKSKIPMSVQLADSFLQLQLQSHLHDLEGVTSEDGEEMLQLIQEYEDSVLEERDDKRSTT